MNRYRVSFNGPELKPMTINENEYKGLIKVLNNSKFVQLKGKIIATNKISLVEPIKEEPLYLGFPDHKPIPKSFFEKLKNELSERFGWIK